MKTEEVLEKCRGCREYYTDIEGLLFCNKQDKWLAQIQKCKHWDNNNKQQEHKKTEF